MRNKREMRNKTNRIFNIIENHVNQNIKEYFTVTAVFVVGIIIGVALINFSSQENKETIVGYINGFIQSIKSDEYKIDGGKLLIKSIISNIKFACIMWIAGSTIIGIPIIYGMVGYKGLCIGYSVSAIVATIGKSQGILVALITLLAQNIIAIPCILALAVSSTKLHAFIMKIKGKDDMKFEIYRHTMFSLIMTGGLIISSLLEYLFTMAFFSGVIANFI